MFAVILFAILTQKDYNYLFQQLALMAGGWQAYTTYHFVEFFPLHRSQTVMDKLNNMMEELAVSLNWNYYWSINWQTQTEHVAD